MYKTETFKSYICVATVSSSAGGVLIVHESGILKTAELLITAFVDGKNLL